MTKRQLRPRKRSVVHPPAGSPDGNGNIPGHSPILALVSRQFRTPERSAMARMLGQSPLTDDARSWFDAAVSDAEVGHALARMGPEWTVFHSLPVGSGMPAVGHLVIGPGGVFIVGTRSHAGKVVRVSQRTFLIADVRHPYIREMEFEMGMVERLLSDAAGLAVEVSGVIAVVASRSITVEQKHRDVDVINAPELSGWLTRRPAVLAPAQIARIVSAAEHEGTWEHDGLPASDAGELHAEFSALRREVRSAWRIQLSWAAVVLLITTGGVAYVAYSIIAHGSTGLAVQ
jgi:hypothetical protein